MNLTEQNILTSLEKAISLEIQENSLVKKRKTTARTKRKSRISRKHKFNLLEHLGTFIFKYKKQILASTLSIIMLSFALFSSYIAYAYMASDDENIVQMVMKHAVLPNNEVPKVYIVQSEKSEMFNNSHYGNPEIGDNVVVYEKTGKIVVYRKAEDKIVNIVSY